MKKKPLGGFAPELIGTTVVGERGQIVIPKEARDAMKLTAGSRLAIMIHPKGGLIMLPVENLRAALAQMTAHVADLTKSIGA